MLYSHGNNQGKKKQSNFFSGIIVVTDICSPFEDIGHLHDWLQRMCAELNVHILVYDYVGYGLNAPHGRENCSERVLYLHNIITLVDVCKMKS